MFHSLTAHFAEWFRIIPLRSETQGYQKYGENNKFQSGALAIQWTDTRTGNRHFPLIFKLSA